MTHSAIKNQDKIALTISLLIILLIGHSCTEKSSTKIQLGESAVVNFSFQNVTDSINLNIYNLPIISASKFNKTAIIDSDGEKQFVIPCEYPSIITITAGNNEFTGYLIPKDTLAIAISFTDSNGIEKLNFTGESKEICEYFYRKQQDLGYHDLRIPLNSVSSNPDDILHNTDSLMNLELQYLKSYSLNSKLPDWFVQTEETQIIYLCNSFKDSRKAYVTKFLKQSFEPGTRYYESIDTIKINNTEARWSYWYFYFIKSRLIYQNISEEERNPQERMDLITEIGLKAANTKLTGEISDIFKYEILNSYLRWTKNLNDFDRYLQQQKNDFTNQYFLSSLIEQRNLLTDSIVKDRNDENRNVPKNAINVNDSIPYFYLPDNNGNFFSSKDFNDKLVYLNFWATWCKPCIASFPDKKILIEKFKDRNDVVFLNICISSEKQNWEDLLIDKNIGGINLFSNENWSTILKQNFNVDVIPTYLLVKNGIVIKPFCDGPEHIEDDILSNLN